MKIFILTVAFLSGPDKWKCKILLIARIRLEVIYYPLFYIGNNNKHK